MRRHRFESCAFPSTATVLLCFFCAHLFRSIDCNVLGCYVSDGQRHQGPGVTIDNKKVIQNSTDCGVESGVIRGDKIDPLVELEHKDSLPAYYVQANYNKIAHKIIGKDGLKLKGPILFEYYFNTVDAIVCYKMVWNCSVASGEKEIVSKYGVTLKGQKKKLCPTVKNTHTPVPSCKVYECEDNLCNGANSRVLSKVTSAFVFTFFAVIRNFILI